VIKIFHYIMIAALGKNTTSWLHHCDEVIAEKESFMGVSSG